MEDWRRRLNNEIVMSKCSRCKEESDRVYSLPHREVDGRQLCGSCMVATLIDREGQLFAIKEKVKALLEYIEE